MRWLFTFMLAIGLAACGESGDGSTGSGLGALVIPNPDVPRGRPLCGAIEHVQGCQILFQNTRSTDVTASSFFVEARKATGLSVFVIQAGNLAYETTVIPPGKLAQINIPARTTAESRRDTLVERDP